MKVLNRSMRYFYLILCIVFVSTKTAFSQNTYVTATNLGTLTCAGSPYTNIASGTTVGAGNDCGNTSSDRWYSFTIASTSDVTISLCNGVTTYDSYLRLYNSGAANCGAATQISSNDDGCGSQSTITQTGLAAGTYIIMIEGWSANEGPYQLDMTVSNCAGPMTFTSSTVTQANTSSVSRCGTNQEIIGVQIATTGASSPFNATSFRVRTNGSTSPAITANVTNIDIYYTGTSSTFATTTLFGSAAPQVSGSNIDINGSQVLSAGTNYFWVVYDMNAVATVGDIVDAECTQITMSGAVGNKIPSVTAPAGTRIIAVCNPSPGGVVVTDVKSWFKVNNYSSGATTWANSVANVNLASLNSTVAPVFTAAGSNWNYNPSLTFDGTITTDNFRASIPNVTDVLGLTGGALIVVGTYPGGGAPRGPIGYFGSPGVNHNEFSYQSTGTWFRGGIGGGPAGEWVAATTPMSSIPSINSSLYSVSAGTTDISAFYNSLSNGTGSEPTVFVNVAPHDFGVGVIPSAHDFTGTIVEAISVSKNLTAIERLKVESYLAIKYGITLSNSGGGAQGDYTATDGTLIWDASVTPSYHNDVIGIGRDDAEALTQKQAHTLNDISRVYLNTLQTANTANTGAFNLDKSYVVLGHNTGALNSTAASNAEVPGACGLFSRIAREWKVTKTNLTNTISVDIKLSAAALPGSVTASELRFLVDNDGDFSNGGTTCYATGDGTGIIISYADPVITVSGISATHIANNSTMYVTIGSIKATTPLPIELLSFTTECKNDHHVVAWTTASEKNNEYFTIEKSEDAENFYPVAIVSGSGNSTSQLDYRWIDPATNNDMVYYRLKQTDYDGAVEDHGIRSSTCKLMDDFAIYPNPFENNFTINFDDNMTYPLSLEVYDYLGRIIYEQQIATNNMTITLGEELLQGTYFVKVFNETKQLVGRVIKMN